jgi:quercetin dioxygenase-like cupin family protein
MIPEMGNAGPAMAVVFGEPGVLGKPFGGLFRVPAGGLSPLHTHTSEYWAVMLDGTESGRVLTEDAPVAVPAGSFWFQPKEAVHVNECLSDAPCTFFVYFPDGMDYLPAEH